MEIKIIYWNVPKYTLYDAEHNFYASNENIIILWVLLFMILLNLYILIRLLKFKNKLWIQAENS